MLSVINCTTRSQEHSNASIQLLPAISNFVDLLLWRAKWQTNKTAYIFLQDGETESASITYGELDLQAKRIASHLQFMGLEGERALLLYPSGLEFIKAFFGCLYAKVIPVPLCVPRRNQNLGRLQSVLADAEAKIALTNQGILGNLEKHFRETPDLTSLYWWATDKQQELFSDNLQWQAPKINHDDVCFLQYTSGSTGKPKGVMVSHGNLFNNSEAIKQGFGNTEKSIGVGWLPLFHDMGLIGNVIQPLYSGIPCILMPPVAFIQKPIRWLQTISHYQATTTGGPNFAYELCLRKVTDEQKENLDLSSWEVAFNGAEPVKAEILEGFASKFASCGFRKQSFYPCYGMAEATLFISGGQKTKSPSILNVDVNSLTQNQIREAQPEEQKVSQLVSCGHSWLGHKIVIANPDTLEKCKSNQVGEIWLSGRSIAQGYWNQPEATKATFHAYLKDTKEGPFLRTGDLGFITKDGELFVTGRLKDVIIIRGRNHYPQDIEKVVEESHEALIPNHSAAFSIKIAGEEKLVVVSEIDRRYRIRRRSSNNSEIAIVERRKQKDRRQDNSLDLNPSLPLDLQNKPVFEEIVNNIRQTISRNHGLQVHSICLIRFGSIPKTSSGKIQRYSCCLGFMENKLNIVYRSPN